MFSVKFLSYKCAYKRIIHRKNGILIYHIRGFLFHSISETGKKRGNGMSMRERTAHTGAEEKQGRIGIQSECRVLQREDVLLAVEGFARFAVLLPLLRMGGWTKAGFGVLTAACIFWCGFCVWAEKKLRQERTAFFETIGCGSGGAYLSVCFAFVWFFTAQESVFLYLALWMVRRIWAMTGGGPAAWDAFVLLPALTLVVVNSGFGLRSFCARVWRELLTRYERYHAAHRMENASGSGEHFRMAQRIVQSILKRSGGVNILWWAAALAAVSMALGYRDEYCAAGFYLAYNWQLLASFAALLCVFFTVRKNCEKRDCRD